VLQSCESASNIDPTLIRVQAVEVSVKFLNFFGSHRRPIGTPTDLNKLVSNQRFGRFGEGSMLEADSHVGTLEVSPSWPYSSEQPNVHTEIELDFARLLSCKVLRDFLASISSHTAISQDQFDTTDV
jgi:hypothetical protein